MRIHAVCGSQYAPHAASQLCNPQALQAMPAFNLAVTHRVKEDANNCVRVPCDVQLENHWSLKGIDGGCACQAERGAADLCR